MNQKISFWGIALLAISFLYPNNFANAQVLESDSLALVDLYNSTLGPQWSQKNGWLSSTVDKWFGVKIEETNGIGRVTNIELRNNNLIGTLPTSIGSFTELEILDLQGNNLSDAIPAELWSCTNAEKIFLLKNRFEGTIPAGISTMQNLQEFDVSSNRGLTGTFPAEVFTLTGLERLYAYDCSWTGAIDPSLANMVNLERIYFYDNEITDFPTLTSLPITSRVRIYYNKLGFEPLENNNALGLTIDDWNYNPQYRVGTEQNITAAAGSTASMTANVSGANNSYQWFKNGVMIPSATNASAATRTLMIPSVSTADKASYYCQVSNSVITDLVISTETFHLNGGAPAASFVEAETNSDGSQIRILLDQKILDNNESEKKNFVVDVNGVFYNVNKTAITADSLKLKLFINPLLDLGDAITVSYTPGGFHTFEGAPLNAFSSQPVINTVKNRPTIVSAVTSNDGTQIFIKLNEAITSIPSSPSSFAVYVNGTKKAIATSGIDTTDPSRIALTLAVGVGSGDRVFVDFVSGFLEGTGGGFLNYFYNQPVANALTPKPLFQSASTSSSNSVAATFNVPMDATTPASGFRVRVDGADATISNIAVRQGAPNVYLITLGSSFDGTQTIQLSYTQGSVVSAAGGILESFGNQIVSNNIVAGIDGLDLVTSLSAYPNPFASTITVQIPAEFKTGFEIQVINATGKTLINHKTALSVSEMDLDLNMLAHGTYLVVIKNSDAYAVTRVMKH